MEGNPATGQIHSNPLSRTRGGVGIKEVKEMIGHRDISMTDRYSHLPMQYKETLQRQFEKQYEKFEFEDVW